MARIAVIETNKGIIKFELLEKDSPKTTENFRLLAERGYYNGLTFHRVIKNFIIQGGDPLGTGYGGESAWGGYFDDEINLRSELYKGFYQRGTVAMANAGPNTNGSQFFIMQADYPLPPKYTKFGKVIEGIEVVDLIAEVPTNDDDRPLEKVFMKKVYILEENQASR
jgi:cyclophilin family peptidyl-prolyl cis-trans isomerase